MLELEMVFDVEIMGRHFTTDARFSVACKRLSGKVHVRMGAVPADRIWFGFHSEPDIDLDINSLIGQTNPIANIPKLASILIYKVKQELIEVMVLPDMEDIQIPERTFRTWMKVSHEFAEADFPFLCSARS
jgi:hypothetical protein